MKLKTPHKDLLPHLPDEDMDRLRSDLKKHGQREPVLAVGDTILDGHHRYEILGDKAEVRQIDVPEDQQDAYAIAVNLNRRNLSTEQRADVRDKQKAIALRLKEAGKTQQQIADILRVARETVRNWLENIPDGQEANTFTPLDSRISVTSVMREEIERRATDGQTQKEIADGLLLSQPHVGRILRQAEAKKNGAAKVDELTSKKVSGEFDKLYDVVVMDPPWPMEKIKREAAPDQWHFGYDTTTEGEIGKIAPPVKAHAHVWLWTTHRFLPMAFRLLDLWELKYVCTFVWHKAGGFQPFGLPQYNCEFALYARSGSPRFVTTKNFKVCFEAKRTKHSEKPEVFYDLVRRVTKGDRLDMYNRRKISGFEPWGKEAAK